MVPIEEDHRALVLSLVKSGDDILHEMNNGQAHLLHMAVGVAGEAGELLDAIKKAAIYQKPLDIDNVIEELGDLEFYLRGIREHVGVERSTVLATNIDKLRRRYPDNRYTNHQAQQRADKQGENHEAGR